MIFYQFAFTIINLGKTLIISPTFVKSPKHLYIYKMRSTLLPMHHIPIALIIVQLIRLPGFLTLRFFGFGVRLSFSDFLFGLVALACPSLMERRKTHSLSYNIPGHFRQPLRSHRSHPQDMNAMNSVYLILNVRAYSKSKTNI